MNGTEATGASEQPRDWNQLLRDARADQPAAIEELLRSSVRAAFLLSWAERRLAGLSGGAATQAADEGVARALVAMVRRFIPAATSRPIETWAARIVVNVTFGWLGGSPGIDRPAAAAAYGVHVVLGFDLDQTANVLGIPTETAAERIQEGRRRWIEQHESGDLSIRGCADDGASLDAWLDGRLLGAARARFKHHLENCVECTAALARFDQEDADLRTEAIEALTTWPGLATALSTARADWARRRAEAGKLRPRRRSWSERLARLEVPRGLALSVLMALLLAFIFALLRIIAPGRN
ncbi:MAG: zf-HC2 domain-containing protein [Candidatus Eisenbacteria bacterium]|nr:zf-HC2 domain-containing protein [Candidatus Eisenbacteria bacterium]